MHNDEILSSFFRHSGFVIRHCAPGLPVALNVRCRRQFREPWILAAYSNLAPENGAGPSPRSVLVFRSVSAFNPRPIREVLDHIAAGGEGIADLVTVAEILVSAGLLALTHEILDL